MRGPGRPILALLLLWLAAPAAASGTASALALRVLPAHVKQGGIGMVEVTAPVPVGRPALRVGGRPLPATGNGPVAETWRTAIGVDLDARPGSVPVRAEVTDPAGRTLAAEATLTVVDGKYPVQRLTLPRSWSDLGAATLERIAREKTLLDALWERATPERFGRGSFRAPLDGADDGSGFGLRRIINGDPRAPHSGVDFGAAAGTPVLASQTGLVAVAEEHFFGGRSVILDHGLGLYTMYFHLEEILVRAGQRVDRGAVLGRVGATGRATGPHLHWGVRLLGARVDPGELLKLSLDGW